MKFAKCVFSALALAIHGVVLAAIPQTERDTLLQLYNATGGVTWTSHSYDGWAGSAGTECQWGGIGCDASAQHVITLQLNSNNLTGSLPDLSGLPKLQRIDVQSNALTGALPSLSALPDLKYFNASGNRLVGVMPDLSASAQLTYFNVSTNQIGGALPALSGLTQLQYFNANQNQLTGAIPPLAGMAQLQAFGVSGNHLSGSLPSLDGLSQLSSFGASNNQLGGAIPALTSTLSTFDVSANRLSGALPALANLPNLYSFAASDNLLTGTIPMLTGLTNLHALNLSNNLLTGSIPALTDLQNIQWFDVSANQLSGSLPSFAGASTLKTFKASNNALTGAVPSLGNLVHLVEIDLDGNQLSGDPPDGSKAILTLAHSAICPNAFNIKDDRVWDFATGVVPWHSVCTKPQNPNQRGLTGTWYNAATSGQGFLMETYPDLFGSGRGLVTGGWFTYTPFTNIPSTKNWFTLQGPMSAASPYSRVGIYQAAGGNFNAGPKIPAAQVGTGTLLFTDCTHAVLHYFLATPPSGTEGIITLSRLDSNITCGQQGNNGADASTSLLSGAWYDPTTSGQGLFFNIDPVKQVLFAAWYTFPLSGGPLAPTFGTGQSWFTLQAPFVGGAIPTQNIPIYSASGGYLNQPDPVSTVQVGSANLTVSGCTSLTLSYSFTAGELQGSKGQISLQRVGPAPTGCK